MTNRSEPVFEQAKKGNIDAFQELFSEFHQQLKSYLYRLVTDRHDAEDLAHDTFVKSFDKISSCRGLTSFKSWVFSIATHLAFDHLKKYSRWKPNAQDLSKQLAIDNPDVFKEIQMAGQNTQYNAYEIIEHIDFCFTCISKVLPLEQQVALLLKDVYDFPVGEIEEILSKSNGVVKHLLIDARKTMRKVFDNRCALINKNGACHQCSELTAFFNPRQDQQVALMKLNFTKHMEKYDSEKLLELRTALVKNINPMYSKGADLQEAIMICTRKAIGEINY